MKRSLWILIAGLTALTAEAQFNPPVLGLMNPSTATAGVNGVTISLTGSNFAIGSVVLWSGSALPTSYVSINQLTASVSSTLLATPGTFAVAVQNPDGSRSNSLIFTVSRPPLVIMTTTLPAATAGQPYSATLAASSGAPPYTWSLGGGVMPSGLALNANGTITGTPDTPGLYNITVRVTDQLLQSASQPLTLTVNVPPLSITTSSPLPSGTVGTAYAQTFLAASGTPPYTWSSTGALPAGLVIDPVAGTLSGIPTARGTFNFNVQVRDRAGLSANKTFSLTIQAAPLVIQTGTLFNGTVGVPYAQTFAATGGILPYTWSLTGQISPLVFDPATATISGTPTAPATYNFTVQVIDSAGTTTSNAYTLVVEVPRLSILNTSPLPAGTAETAYSYRFSATGGTAPFQWSISSGSAGDLVLDASTGALSGVPSTAATLNFTVRVSDNAGQSSTKSFTLSIAPATLSITTPTQLPDATVATPVLYQMAASGGVLPYTWSANGLPDGLTLDASTGIITGTPKVSGSFLFNIRVTDTARATVVGLFRLNVRAPALPGINILGLPATAQPAQQYPLRLTLSEGYPLPLNGNVSLTFSPDSGNGDNSVRFASGGRSVSFTIDAGSTQATISNFALQTGTVAGTIQLTVFLRVGETDITPNPAPSFSTKIDRAAPQITSAKIIRGSSSVSIQITGFTTAREVTQAVFRFKATSGSQLQTSDFTVPVEALFSKHFQDTSSAGYGGQFVFTQPFTVQGDVNGVLADSVTLTNRVGSTTATVTQ